MCLLYECDRHDRFVCVVCVIFLLISIRAVLVTVTAELRIAPNVKDVLFGPNEYVAVTENVSVSI